MPIRPKSLNVLDRKVGDVRVLRRILSDVAYVQLVLCGRVAADTARLSDATARISRWLSSAIEPLTEVILEHNPESEKESD